MEKLKGLLEEKIAFMNQDSGKQELLRNWISGYRGKVIGFKSDEGEAFHVVFVGGRADLRQGNYPSCEFSYIGPEEVLCEIILKKSSGMKAGRDGSIKGWGSVNESLKFESLLG